MTLWSDIKAFLQVPRIAETQVPPFGVVKVGAGSSADVLSELSAPRNVGSSLVSPPVRTLRRWVLAPDRGQTLSRW